MTKLFKTGLILAGLLAVVDLASPALTDGKNPPYFVAFISAGLGLLTLAGVVAIWRGAAGRGWFRTVLITRTVSALSSVPAFFAGVPAALLAAVAVSIVATVAACWLLWAERPATTS